MRILYVFAQFPTTPCARANGPTVYDIDYEGIRGNGESREVVHLWGRDEYATARLPFYRSEDIGFINIVG